MVCKTSLTQGRYTWQHNQVLRSLAAVPEYPPHPTGSQHFLSARVKPGSPPPVGLTLGSTGLENAGRPGQKTVLPTGNCIHQPASRPCSLFLSSFLKLIYIIELTVPCEGAVEEVYERKKLRYTDLAADAQQ